ncbi:MAG TPA: type I DNA topoisomerase [Acidimicrobiales bacterium]
MPKPLVIVESPAKARTIAGYLGQEYVVESSIGHVRDLPASPAEVPEEYRSGEMARLAGVDPENDFKTIYISRGRAKDQIKKLRLLLKDASELYLATDEDREGESIAWHLHEVLKPRVPVRRMVFHEITPQAIQRAVDESRDIDLPLVDAQETRRIVDRLYGWELSPVLWRRVRQGLSAGRVQSVATRLVVERERERMAFRPAGWSDLEGDFVPAASDDDDRVAFTAGLHAVDDRRVADRNSFDQQGNLKKPDVVVLDEAGATGLAARLDGKPFTVTSVEQRPWTERPKPPFMTSTLQQAASSKLRWGAARTMQVAQRLYENGYITYMRTDSTTLSETAINAARAAIASRYGQEFLADGPRQYARKVKNAQEAHEAIRPAGDEFRSPEEVSAAVDVDEARLYDLIWRRTVASQMRDALGQRTSVVLAATSSTGERVDFQTSGTVITFAGHRRAYGEGDDVDEGASDEQDRRLPPLVEGDVLDANELRVRSHTTSPPNRYTEASLVKALEELGIGRPSTYAAILSTIQDRGYVFKRGSSLIPTWLAFAVIGLLETHFPRLVDYRFTAELEDDLDAIARREKERVPWLRDFYFGDAPATDGKAGLRALVTVKLDEIDAREVNSFPIGTTEDGDDVVVRVGRYGPYLQKGEERASIPEDLPPDELTVARALELLAEPSGDRALGEDPDTGLQVFAKAGRFGPYVQLGEQEEGSKVRPKTASLFKSMTLDSVTLEDALRLLQLPRTVGADEDGNEITALNGRYGPYIKRKEDTRSLDSEDELFTVSLEHALAMFAAPKLRRGQQRVAAPPLKELGEDPVSGKPVVVKEGRFGPYVTDGETNASLRAGDSVEEITMERAAELLADRRAKGPTKKAARKKAAASKKATKKATAAKQAAKKKKPE